MSRRVVRDVVKERHSEVHNTHQDVEEIEVSSEEFDAVRSTFSISTACSL